MEEKKENTEIEKSIKSKDFLGNDKGVAVVEVILILVVLIALVIIFRDQIVALASVSHPDPERSVDAGGCSVSAGGSFLCEGEVCCSAAKCDVRCSGGLRPVSF